jgi:glycolate oxidase iron-sulfur subunit
MRGLSDRAIEPTANVLAHLDSCLDCRACETACPSGVIYHELIEETRDRLAMINRKTPGLRWLVRNILVRPTRLKLAVLPIRIMQRLGIYGLLERLGLFDLLPPSQQKMREMLPLDGPLWPRRLPILTTARRPLGKTVGFFAGCVGGVLYDDVNRKAIRVLAQCGVDVHVPAGQGCCGAIHQHGGALDDARRMARRNIELFRGRDYIVTNIAGCGSTLAEYDVLLRDDAKYAAPAVDFRRRFRDINQMLCELPLPKLEHPVNLTAAYQDACHLAHAQRITQSPRDLLARVPGLKLVPLAEHDLCCGAAGTYNLTHPKTASDLARRKLDHLAAAKVNVLIVSNAGCAAHLLAEAKSRGQTLRVVHPVELIHEAMFGPTV